MSRMSSAPAADSQPELLASALLDDSFSVVVEGELAARFERARLAAAQAARTRLEGLLPFAVDELTAREPKLQVGPLTGRPLLDIDPLVLVELAVARGSGGSAQRARLHSAEGVLQPGSSPETSAAPDLTDPQVLMSLLSYGWMLEIPGLESIAPRIARLTADIEAAVDTRVELSGWYGISSALGPPPQALPHSRLLVQLAGRRQVLVTGPDEREQFRTSPGLAALVPPGMAVHHLPLDEDTLHLEFRIPVVDAPDLARRTRRALQPARVGRRAGLARQVVFAESSGGQRFRWSAPGGVVALNEPAAVRGSTALAAGGQRLVVNEAAVEPLAKLAGGGSVGIDELADLDEGSRSAESFAAALWSAGLLEAEEAPSEPEKPQLLNAVAHADHAGFPSLETLLDAAIEEWRSPEPAELPVPTAGLDVAVKRLPPEFAGSELLQSAMALINLETFQFALAGIDGSDPVLLVRYGRDSAAATSGGFAADLHESAPGRKLTFFLPLDGNAGDTGAVRFAAGSEAMVNRPGRLSAFASFRPWMLKTPASGVCHMLLGRVHGPAFV